MYCCTLPSIGRNRDCEAFDHPAISGDDIKELQMSSSIHGCIFCVLLVPHQGEAISGVERKWNPTDGKVLVISVAVFAAPGLAAT
jgi:hypothetical protein